MYTMLVLFLTRCRTGAAAGAAGRPAAGQRWRGRTRVPLGPHRGKHVNSDAVYEMSMCIGMQLRGHSSIVHGRYQVLHRGEHVY